MQLSACLPLFKLNSCFTRCHHVCYRQYVPCVSAEHLHWPGSEHDSPAVCRRRNLFCRHNSPAVCWRLNIQFSQIFSPSAIFPMFVPHWPPWSIRSEANTLITRRLQPQARTLTKLLSGLGTQQCFVDWKSNIYLSPQVREPRPGRAQRPVVPGAWAALGRAARLMALVGSGDSWPIVRDNCSPAIWCFPGLLSPKEECRKWFHPCMSRFHCPLCTRQRTTHLRLFVVARVTASACGTSGYVYKHVEV